MIPFRSSFNTPGAVLAGALRVTCNYSGLLERSREVRMLARLPLLSKDSSTSNFDSSAGHGISS